MLCRVTRDLGFCLIYKNASSSVRAARIMQPVSRGEFLGLSRRVALLREPHDRFESTWRDYYQRRDVRLSFEAFAETAFAERFPFKTPELIAQADYCTFANHLVRWDFAELAEVLGVEVPHVNRTRPAPAIWPAAIKERFAEHYAADLALWQQVTAPGVPWPAPGGRGVT